MKTKICLAMFFSAFFMFNSFATKYMVIKVEGYVTVTYNRVTTQLVRKGQSFDATVTKGELQFGKNSSISFGVANSKNQVPQIAGCADPNCRNAFLMPGNVAGGTRRDLDAFLAGNGDFSDEFATNLHISSLQLAQSTLQNTMQEGQFKMRDRQRTGDLQMKTTTAPNATRMKAPALDKAATKVRQQ